MLYTMLLNTKDFNMFYCNDCADKYEYPESFVKSRGTCECCGNHAICNDRPSSSLPLPKNK